METQIIENRVSKGSNNGKGNNNNQNNTIVKTEYILIPQYKIPSKFILLSIVIVLYNMFVGMLYCTNWLTVHGDMWDWWFRCSLFALDPMYLFVTFIITSMIKEMEVSNKKQR